MKGISAIDKQYRIALAKYFGSVCQMPEDRKQTRRVGGVFHHLMYLRKLRNLKVAATKSLNSGCLELVSNIFRQR